MFLTNPESVYYKVDYEDLPKSLQEQFFVAIPAGEIWRSVEPFLDSTRTEAVSPFEFLN